MPRKRSDASYWSRLTPVDERDGMPPNRGRFMDIWVRSGRLPPPPVHMDYPWSAAEWASNIAEYKQRFPSPEAAAYLHELETDLQSPETRAEMDAAKRRWEKHEQERTAPFQTYLRELERRGVNRRQLLTLITGGTPDQPVNLGLMMRHLSFLAFMHGTWREYGRHLRKLWRQYRTEMVLLTDETLRPETRRLLREDLEDIFRCLRYEAGSGVFAVTVRSSGLTVTPGRDLSRQTFWTPPAVAIVNYLYPILGSFEECYRVTTHLFHLGFNFPDKPHLIKQRYRHAQRKAAAPR